MFLHLTHVLDSGYKYQFDRFNDVFRYVPLNGDIAGIAVRSDVPLKHGSHLQVSTVVKFEMLLNLHLTRRNHKEMIFTLMESTLLFPSPDKALFSLVTRLCSPSQVRLIELMFVDCLLFLRKRLLQLLSLVSLNSTMHSPEPQFKNLIEPFLLDVQSRRGMIDFKVVCDESNNTPDVIDRNEFVADIFIKPQPFY